MRRRRCGVAALGIAGALAVTSAWGAELDLVLDARPGTILLGNKTGRFKARGPVADLEVIEECGGLSTFPNLQLGLGVDTERFYFDVGGKAGLLLTDRFRSPFVGVEGAAQYKFRKNVSLGPHAGFTWYYTPDWSGAAPLEFDETTGFHIGLLVSVGYDVQFVFAVDYVYVDPFEVTRQDGWEVTEDEVDFTSLGIQFGIRGRF